MAQLLLGEPKLLPCLKCWFSQHYSATLHLGGVRTQGLWPPNSNSAEIFLQCTYPQVSLSYVYSIGSYRVDKQTNRRRWKHATPFATLRRVIKQHVHKNAGLSPIGGISLLPPIAPSHSSCHLTSHFRQQSYFPQRYTTTINFWQAWPLICGWPYCSCICLAVYAVGRLREYFTSRNGSNDGWWPAA